MKIKTFKSQDELSNYASDLIINEINQKPDMLLCAATGNSPTETYQKLVEKKQNFKTEKLRVVKLDEWGGIAPQNPGSCESYLQEKVLEPLQIQKANYVSFLSNSITPENEIVKVQKYLDQNGPIDLCILGVGVNGHIAFNEPDEVLQPHCHIAKLSGNSMAHSMTKHMGEKPTYGLTLGMADILRSKKIILLVVGKGKKEVLENFLKGKISTQLPASFSWLHEQVECLILDE